MHTLSIGDLIMAFLSTYDELAISDLCLEDRPEDTKINLAELVEDNYEICELVEAIQQVDAKLVKMRQEVSRMNTERVNKPIREYKVPTDIRDAMQMTPNFEPPVDAVESEVERLYETLEQSDLSKPESEPERDPSQFMYDRNIFARSMRQRFGNSCEDVEAPTLVANSEVQQFHVNQPDKIEVIKPSISPLDFSERLITPFARSKRQSSEDAEAPTLVANSELTNIIETWLNTDLNVNKLVENIQELYEEETLQEEDQEAEDTLEWIGSVLFNALVCTTGIVLGYLGTDMLYQTV